MSIIPTGLQKLKSERKPMRDVLAQARLLFSHYGVNYRDPEKMMGERPRHGSAPNSINHNHSLCLFVIASSLSAVCVQNLRNLCACG
jgi:hypothetical protein